MTAPIATSTQSPDAIAATVPPRQRQALADLVAGRQPMDIEGVREMLKKRQLVEVVQCDVCRGVVEFEGMRCACNGAEMLELTPMGRLVAAVLGEAS